MHARGEQRYVPFLGLLPASAAPGNALRGRVSTFPADPPALIREWQREKEKILVMGRFSGCVLARQGGHGRGGGGSPPSSVKPVSGLA